jgi:hypothetical protein
MKSYQSSLLRDRHSYFKAVALALTLLSMSACAGVHVLNPSTLNEDNGVIQAGTDTVIGPYSENAVVMLTANGGAQNFGSPASAGIVVSLELENGTVLAQDNSVQSPDGTGWYRASASYNFFLPKETTKTIKATTLGSGQAASANTNTTISLTAIALKAN